MIALQNHTLAKVILCCAAVAFTILLFMTPLSSARAQTTFNGNTDSRAVEDLRAAVEELVKNFKALNDSKSEDSSDKDTNSSRNRTGDSTSGSTVTTKQGSVTVSTKCVSPDRVSADISIDRWALWDYNLLIDGSSRGISSKNVPIAVELDHDTTHSGIIQNWDIVPSITFNFEAQDCSGAGGYTPPSDSEPESNPETCTQDESGSPTSCLRHTDPGRWAELNAQWKREQLATALADAKELLDKIKKRADELMKNR